MRTAFFALALVGAPAMAVPLSVPVGENWVFALDHGQPVRARKVVSAARPARGEVKVTVRALFGTMMTVTNNSRQGYTFKAELIGADGNAVTAPGAIFRLLDRSRIGKTCTIEFLRDGAPQSATIVPQERVEPGREEAGSA